MAPNGPHLDVQLREHIISWYHNDNVPVEEIAQRINSSISTVYRILRQYNHTNTVLPSASPGRPRILSTEDIEFISSLLDDTPVLFLDEIQDQLEEVRGVHVSLATLSRTLRNMSLSNKSISKKAAERDDLLRATWVAEWGDLPVESFVWLDESSVDDLTNQRRRGWAPVGRACVRRDTFLRGQRYSILPALSTDDIIALDIVEGSVNKEQFLEFLNDQLVCCLYIKSNGIMSLHALRQAPQLNPFPGPRSVVVMDNCAIHHDEEIRRIVVDECGMFTPAPIVGVVIGYPRSKACLLASVLP